MLNKIIILNENSFLLKDGSLEYATVKNKGNKDFKLSSTSFAMMYYLKSRHLSL